MQLPITNPQLNTGILFVILLILSILSTRRKKTTDLFPTSTTQELKGFAILTIMFGHIGYFLDSNDTFLYPLSIASGVGVNLFLFLSGYGLTKSRIKKSLSVFQFYKKRLIRLFIPMWMVITLFLLLDWLLFSKTYPLNETLQNYAGFFPVADIYTSLNSVLWYFSFILFYYLLFPLLTFRTLLFFSPILIYLFSVFFFKQNLPINKDVLTLYTLHLFAFPLGITFALLPEYLKKIRNGEKYASRIETQLKNLPRLVNISLLSLLLILFCYTSVHSKVGEDKAMEQLISNITMFSILLAFLLKRFQIYFLNLLGTYSYEIYLLHWPVIFRYDLLYPIMPASIATSLYLGFLLGIGLILQKTAEKVALLIDKKK